MLMRWLPAFLLLSLVAVTPLRAEEIAAPERPALWSSDETLLLLGGLAGAGVVSLWDENLSRKAENNQAAPFEELASGFNLVGHPVACFGLAGATWGYGLWTEDTEIVQTGRQATAAVVAAELATLALKAATGRERPDNSASSGAFHPFSLEREADSFPSGHTAGAFALAAVFARHAHTPAASWGYYSLAGLVGLSRVYAGDHWASDVVAGAVIGELAGRLAIKWQQQLGGPSAALYPWAGPGLGVQWVARF
ncbi:phosphatase PAP2 family protein [Desulfuromonas sp. DDH964]|uniref:phosphatase PAP2 family protein n=1 Tax=Desulfuromonas sp. DDH964 TaxID=1823759 RepID=UPI00082D1F06|nr:phosphatase PAP2 family protein [Desulfuromonas sp. DDH964]